MAKYTKVKSEFIKEKIKNAKWKDSGYIDDLIFLEYGIRGMGLGWTGGMRYNFLTNKYPKEYKAIYLELNPKVYKRIIEDKKKEAEEEKREDEELEREEKEEEEQDKADWVKAGGRI